MTQVDGLLLVDWCACTEEVHSGGASLYLAWSGGRAAIYFGGTSGALPSHGARARAQPAGASLQHNQMRAAKTSKATTPHHSIPARVPVRIAGSSATKASTAASATEMAARAELPFVGCYRPATDRIRHGIGLRVGEGGVPATAS